MDELSGYFFILCKGENKLRTYTCAKYGTEDDILNQITKGGE